MNDLVWLIIVSILFLSFFAVSEFLYKKGADVELTRKLVHFSGAFVTIFFPFIFESPITVLFLALGFSLIMFLSKKFGLLKSIHGIKRSSKGAFYHPIAIFICFLYANLLGLPWFYVISILILGISDASAALVGKNYGKNEFIVEIGTTKTLEGSIAFFLSSFLIVHLILLLTTGFPRIECVLIALLIATIVTIFEGVSLGGADNLFIPLSVIFILSRNINTGVFELSIQLLVLFSFLVVYLITMLPYKRIGFSAVVLLGLINYVIWVMLGSIYALIIFIFSLLCQKTNLILSYDCEVADKYRVKPIVYVLAVPIACAFLGDFINNIVIYPFIASIICEIIIIRLKLFNNDLNKGLITTTIVSLAVLGVSCVFIQ